LQNGLGTGTIIIGYSIILTYSYSEDDYDSSAYYEGAEGVNPAIFFLRVEISIPFF